MNDVVLWFFAMTPIVGSRISLQKGAAVAHRVAGGTPIGESRRGTSFAISGRFVHPNRVPERPLIASNRSTSPTVVIAAHAKRTSRFLSQNLGPGRLAYRRGLVPAASQFIPHRGAERLRPSS